MIVILYEGRVVCSQEFSAETQGDGEVFMTFPESSGFGSLTIQLPTEEAADKFIFEMYRQMKFSGQVIIDTKEYL